MNYGIIILNYIEPNKIIKETMPTYFKCLKSDKEQSIDDHFLFMWVKFESPEKKDGDSSKKEKSTEARGNDHPVGDELVENDFAFVSFLV